VDANRILKQTCPHQKAHYNKKKGSTITALPFRFS
jgi:hypothetical protein